MPGIDGCVGAALSAKVVPAVTAGQPVWRVDDRLLWLQEDQLVGADAGSWPAWATGMPPGGVSIPASPAELAEYLDAVAGWRDVNLDGAIATLSTLAGRATTPTRSPSPVKPRHHSPALPRRIRCPNDSARQQHPLWTIELAKSKDPNIVTPRSKVSGNFLAAMPSMIAVDGGLERSAFMFQAGFAQTVARPRTSEDHASRRGKRRARWQWARHDRPGR